MHKIHGSYGSINLSVVMVVLIYTINHSILILRLNNSPYTCCCSYLTAFAVLLLC